MSRLPIPESRALRAARWATRVRHDLPVVAIDIALTLAGYLVALWFRFDGNIPEQYGDAMQTFLPIALLCHLGSAWMWGLYGQMWRHASVQEARRILLAGVTATVLVSLVGLTGSRLLPITVVLFGAFATTGLVGVQRFQARLFAFHRDARVRNSVRVIVVGAGEAGAAIVREMLRDSGQALLPVALLDDDPRLQGRSMSGVRVEGTVADLPGVAQRHRADQALLAIPSADGEQVRRVANLADEAGLALKVLPTVAEMVGGDISVRDVRDLKIDDLLGRQQVSTDLASVKALIRRRRVLITGAGGSIGAEIARQVAALEPTTVFLLDHDETHLHDAAGGLAGEVEQILADVRDERRMLAIFAECRPEIVFHAAAHKHVPVLERFPAEAVATNVRGTRNVLRAAKAVGVGTFVFVSTDKAVRPSSVMGATKQLGEQLMLAEAPAGSRWCGVRFGNVLGSRGSVIPTFMRQIESGGPVTVTDARMTRYFMSIPEAVQLVLQAAALARGGEIFMLDMGEPVQIMDMAKRMIRLSGRRPGVDVPIRVTGMRPGEKLAEELAAPTETPHPTSHPSIVALYPDVIAPLELEAGISRLEHLADRHETDTLAQDLFDLLDAPRVSTSQPATLDQEASWDRSSI